MEPGTQRMLMQYLSGAGAGLNPDPWVQNLNQITQQNIAAQSQAGLIDLYKQILAGKMPGAKANLSEKGMNLTMPSGTLGLGEGAGAGAEGHMGAVGDLGAGVSGVPTPNTVAPGAISGAPAQQEGGFLSKLLNPSVSQPGSGTIPPSALAGLSPQDVSAALGGALNIEQLRQKQIIDKFKMMQKPKGDPLESEFPIPHPEAGLITQRQWSSLPTEEKEFASYIHAAKKLGAPSNELTREFFLTLEPTEKEQFYRAAMEDKGLKDIWLEGMTVATSQPGEAKVTWTTATKELTKRFGKLDPTGMWAVTPDLQNVHRLAQHMLTELKDEGVEPLKAINQAEDRARDKQRLIEKRYQQYLEAAKQIRSSRERDEKIEEINSLFYERYGYLPSEEIR